MTDRTELRARDAAPIVGEREAFEAWWGWFYRRSDSSIQMKPLAWAAWSARAARVPSGGGAREAAEDIAADLRAAPITHDIAGVKQAHVSVEALPTAVDRWAAIITKHIPIAPAGLTEARRAGIVEVIRWVESRERGESFSATDIKRAFGVSDA